jgi:hypothetical protein
VFHAAGSPEAQLSGASRVAVVGGDNSAGQAAVWLAAAARLSCRSIGAPTCARRCPVESPPKPRRSRTAASRTWHVVAHRGFLIPLRTSAGTIACAGLS